MTRIELDKMIKRSHLWMFGDFLVSRMLRHYTGYEISGVSYLWSPSVWIADDFEVLQRHTLGSMECCGDYYYIGRKDDPELSGRALFWYTGIRGAQQYLLNLYGLADDSDS